MLKQFSIVTFAQTLQTENVDHSIALIPDRAASDTLIEILSTRRIRSGWPHPGVYRLREFAQAVIKEADRSFASNRFSRFKIPSTPEQFLLWIQNARGRGAAPALSESYLRFKELRRFHMLDLDFEEWREIVRQLESNSRADLKPMTEFILAYLAWKAEIESQDKISSYWTFLKECTAILNDPSLTIDAAFLARATQRCPAPATTFLILLPLHVELYPLEHKLIEALHTLGQNPAKNIDLLRFDYLEKPAVLSFVEEIGVNQKTVEHLVLALAHHPISTQSTRPTPSGIVHFDHHDSNRIVELSQTLGRSFSLAAEKLDATPVEHSFKLLKLWLDFQQTGAPSEHPLVRDWPLFLQFSNAFGFQPAPLQTPLPENAYLSLLEEFIERHNPLPPQDSTNLFADFRARTPAERLIWLDIFLDFGFFDFLKPAQASENFANLHCLEGTFFGQLAHALPLGFPIALWDDTTLFKNFFDPLSSDTLKQDTFLSSELDPLVEATGISLPKFSKDAAKLLRFMARHPDHFYFLNETRILFSATTPPPLRFNTQGLSLSPSSVETLLQCPAKFYFQNLLRVEESKEWDSEQLDPSLKGQWIHKCLELLFKARPSPSLSLADIQSFLKITLEDLVPNYFGSCTSRNYQELIKFHIPELSQQLSSFYQTHESCVARFFPVRTLFYENKFQSPHAQWPFRFVCDRIDVLPDGNYLLWDYKTGRVPKGKIDTLLRNGTLQLPLYTLLIEALSESQKKTLLLGPDSRCVGMAYLAPLDPQSSLYFYTPPAEAAFTLLAELDQSKAYPFDLDLAQHQTTELLDVATKTFHDGTFSFTPKKQSLCTACPQRFMCGKPFLEVLTELEADEPTPESATP